MNFNIFKIKRGSQKPLVLVLTTDGKTTNITGCTVKIRYKKRVDGAVEVLADCQVLDPAIGKISFTFPTGFSDEIAVYDAEIIVTDTNGVPNVFPDPDNITIVVYKSF